MKGNKGEKRERGGKLEVKSPQGNVGGLDRSEGRGDGWRK